mgnify:CR=1 FL=1
MKKFVKVLALVLCLMLALTACGKGSYRQNCQSHCQADQQTKVEVVDNNSVRLTFKEKQRAVTLGQFAVLYAEDGMCYGGGEIIETK